MLSKTLIKQILITLGSLSVFGLAFLFYSEPVNSIQTNQIPSIKKFTPPIEKEKINFGLPIKINIPEINVSSTIEYVGLTSEGAMDVPKDQNSVAWLETSPRPGEIGNAVIDGHYGWMDGKPSVFDNLYKLRPGDKIYISDDLGEQISFVVKEIKRYSSGANAEKVFISADKKSHLNLITCEGVWDSDSKSYSTRLVIFADKEIN